MTPVDNDSTFVIMEVSRLIGTSVTSASRLDELGMSSEQLLQLMVALEDRFDITVDLVDIFTADTVGDIARLTRA
jgi:acyl carrier protein